MINKFITAGSLSFLPFFLTGQPTIQQADDYTIGSSFEFKFAEPATVFSGPSGSNQYWDFSTLIPNGNSLNEWILDPALTTWAIDYPSATIVQKFSDGRFYYVEKSFQENQAIGLVEVIGSQQYFYSNPLLLGIRPLTFGMTVSDTFSFHRKNPTDSSSGWGHSTLEADGYGSIKTPAGIFTNVMRIRVTRFMQDTLLPSGPVTDTYSQAFFWFDTVHVSHLMKIDSTHSGTIDSKTVEYFYGEVLNTESPVAGSFILFPIPTPGSIHFISPSPGKFRIINLEGVEMMDGSIEDGLQEIHTAWLPDGIYFFNFLARENYFSGKFIIQH